MPSPAEVLVVGSGGFVGSRLVAALRRDGVAVTAATRRPRDAGEQAVDVADAASVRALFTRAPAPAAVVHRAALAHRAPPQASDYERVNHRGLVHVLQAAREAGVPRLVFFSSAAVYGEVGRRAPLAEDAERRPVGPYARSKAAAEDACFDAMANGYPCVVLRFPALYDREWLLDVRKRAYLPGSGGRVLLRVPGMQPRYSLCAVAHATAAVRLALGGGLPSAAYNVTDGEPYSQDEVARVIGQRDGVRRSATLPRALARAALWSAPGLLPRRLRDAPRRNYWKLFEGQVLDDRRIRRAGFVSTLRLDSILA